MWQASQKMTGAKTGAMIDGIRSSRQHEKTKLRQTGLIVDHEHGLCPS
jgi:hypothetical protein